MTDPLSLLTPSGFAWGILGFEIAIVKNDSPSIKINKFKDKPSDYVRVEANQQMVKCVGLGKLEGRGSARAQLEHCCH